MTQPPSVSVLVQIPPHALSQDLYLFPQSSSHHLFNKIISKKEVEFLFVRESLDGARDLATHETGAQVLCVALVTYLNVVDLALVQHHDGVGLIRTALELTLTRNTPL